jgi:hypothetical protein
LSLGFLKQLGLLSRLLVLDNLCLLWHYYSDGSAKVP